MHQMYSTGEVARLLGIHHINRLRDIKRVFATATDSLPRQTVLQ